MNKIICRILLYRQFSIILRQARQLVEFVQFACISLT